MRSEHLWLTTKHANLRLSFSLSLALNLGRFGGSEESRRLQEHCVELQQPLGSSFPAPLHAARVRTLLTRPLCP